jgi:hypothetical protein
MLAIFINPGNYAYRCVGDFAMLQVAVTRQTETCRSASQDTLTNALNGAPPARGPCQASDWRSDRDDADHAMPKLGHAAHVLYQTPPHVSSHSIFPV